MIIVMRTGASQEEIDDVKQAVAEEGLETYVMVGEERIVMGVVGVGVERHLDRLGAVEAFLEGRPVDAVPSTPCVTG